LASLEDFITVLQPRVNSSLFKEFFVIGVQDCPELRININNIMKKSCKVLEISPQRLLTFVKSEKEAD
jgi:hypothetical protein